MTISGIHKETYLQSKIAMIASTRNSDQPFCVFDQGAAGARDAEAFGRLTGDQPHRIAQYARLACFDAAPGSKMRVNGPVAQLDRATVS